MARVVKAHTPLGDAQLMFRSMSGTEGLSQLFEFEVDLLSASASIDLKSVLGKPLSLEIQTAGEPRFLNGQVVRFSMAGREGGTSRHTVYRATVRPWLWYLTRSSDNKIFQDKTVVEILEEVFGDYGFAFEKQLGGTYRCWEYCVQYNESDFAFVSRLMELEGIYYYFKHEQNQHTLVLADDIGAHDPIPGYETIDYFAADRDISQDMEVIRDWQPSEELRSGRYTVDDFNFTTPKGDLMNVRSQPLGGDNASYEMYEWLGDYPAAGDGEHYARVRLEEAQALAQRSAGQATVRGMAPGYKFTMRNSPRSDDNQEYLAVAVSYSLREGGYATGAEDGEYNFDFVVQPTALAFRAPRHTPPPRTSGPQTATVVGPEGEEIWTDQYGRVKVQFHWDRYGQRNENSSRFVRVSQIWAGERFGGVFTPRIGQEVIVDFIGGRPDRPVIVGRVYNADQMPPFALPGEATKSGIVTRSSKGGSEATANAFVFEDRMGAEQILVHAQRNLDVEVEGDETHTTNRTRTTLIKGHESATYETGEERHITGGAVETIDGGEERTVTGGATETVTEGEERTITGGAIETISGGETRFVNGGIDETVNGNVTLTVNGSVVRLVSGADIRIVGGGRIEIINAIDTKLVLGPDTTFVAGPKTVHAPTIDHNATNYTLNTSSYTLTAKAVVYNTPKQTVNTEDHGHWRWTNFAATWAKATAWTPLAFDFYGLKVMLTASTFTSINGVFINLALLNDNENRVKKNVAIGDLGIVVSKLLKFKVKEARGAFFLRAP
ncbi:type VI secretion system Vgr family protein [Variovorax paradoxus]|uniref:type VI secretion system Vgr family protein n=1 Tax=Variovorax paradoxus TaxID=34073 RepID=UPI00277D935E|nr:type VI secretion system tip protein VgrG [Variovorax paradoxus]MDQ0588649.1 type VI secretion system secreted protein VgrG [Variovorax paradoxus]